MSDSSNPYESDALLNQYIFFHYASPEIQFPYNFGGKDGLEFPARCVKEGVNISKLPRRDRALDLGCAVGRSSFELAKSFDEVIGVDYSQTFIDAANLLKFNGSHVVNVHKEGSQYEQLEVRIDPDIQRERIKFEQGDAQDLRENIGTFDVVIACNLICRLKEPMKLISTLPQLVNAEGQLFLTTPFTWLEDYTPKENWLGAGAQDSFTTLRSLLDSHFRLDDQFNIPFLIPETARKFQYTVAMASRWTRKTP